MTIHEYHPYCAHVRADLSLPKCIVPGDLSAALQDDLHNLLQRIETLGAGHLRESCESVSDQIKRTAVSELAPQALYQLPLELAKLESLIKHGEDSLRNELHDDCRKLVEKTLSHLVSAAARRVPKGEQWQAEDCALIGQGARYWAIRHSNSDFIALVARTSEPDALDRLRHRWFMSKQLAALGQPQVLLVATIPFLHAFVKFAPGVSLGHLWTAAKGEDKETEKRTLIKAARSTGALLRKIADLPIEGFEKLVPIKQSDQDLGTTRMWRGEANDPKAAFHLQEFVFGGAASKQDKHHKTLERICVSSQAFDQVADWYQQTFKGQSKICISHIDPHPGNYRYDEGLGQVSILDWEDVAALPEPVMLGRIFQFWITCSKSGALCTSLFDECMHGYEAMETQRTALRESAMKVAAVQYVCYLYRKARTNPDFRLGDCEQTSSPSIEKDSLRRLSAILRHLTPNIS